MNRRGLLVSTVILALSGCAGVPKPVLYEVINRTEHEQTITVTLETTSKLFDKTLLEQTKVVAPDQAGGFDNPDTDADAHEITIEVKGGPTESYQWERNPGVTARVYSDEIEFDEDEL